VIQYYPRKYEAYSWHFLGGGVYEITSLATHFWRVLRAKAVFGKEGLHVIEVPTGLYQKNIFTLLHF
jgi:hypothetical protein